MASHGEARIAAYDAAERGNYFRGQAGLTAHERHTRLIEDYQKYYAGALHAPPSPDQQLRARLQQTDFDALAEGHRFLRSEVDDADVSWAGRLAKRYYDRLFREYAVADLSRYKESKVGFRWRTQAEVISGVGQFKCGAKGCDHTEGLSSYEVNFAYTEAGVRKQALVKLRVCPSCAYKLNYKKEKAFAKAERKRRREAPPDSGAAAARRDSLATGTDNDLPSQRQRTNEAGTGVSSARDAPTGVMYSSKRDGHDASAAGMQPQHVLAGGKVNAPLAAAVNVGQGGSVMSGSDAVWESKQVLQEPSVEEDMDAYLETLFA